LQIADLIELSNGFYCLGLFDENDNNNKKEYTRFLVFLEEPYQRDKEKEMCFIDCFIE
jgi:hypothetical protein